MDEQLIDPNLIAEIKAAQQGRASTQPGAVPAPAGGGFNLGQSLPNILMGLGEMAGGVGQVMSGGKLPNVAAQLRAADDKRTQQEVENRQRQESIKVTQERLAIEKLSTGWDFMKGVAERLGDVDEETGKKLAPMFAERMGVPELGPLLEKTLTNTGLRNTVERTFPAIVQRLGPAEAVKMFQKPDMIPRLMEMETKLKGEESFKRLAGAAQQGIINKDVTPAQLDNMFPGAMDNLTDDHKLKLSELGFSKIKTKGMQENEAKAKVETVAHQENIRQRELDRELRLKENATDNARADANMARLAQQHAETLAAITANRDRIPETARREMDNFKRAYDLTDNLGKLYEDAIKGKGSVTAAFKGALLQSQKGNRFVNVAIKDGFSPAEKKLAAHLNTMYGSLYTMTSERALTEQDAIRNMTSFIVGNDPSQVRENIASRKAQYDTALKISVEGLTGQGRDVSGYDKGSARDHTAGPAKPGVTPSQSEIEAAKKRLGIK